jgi:hypothetical protein
MKKVIKYLSVFFILSGLVIWQIESIYFLFAYGWHMKAINEMEQFWDDISSIFSSVGIVLGFVYLILTVNVINVEREK